MDSGLGLASPAPTPGAHSLRAAAGAGSQNEGVLQGPEPIRAGDSPSKGTASAPGPMLAHRLTDAETEAQREVTSALSDFVNGGAWSQTQTARLQGLHPPHCTRDNPPPAGFQRTTSRSRGPV